MRSITCDKCGLSQSYELYPVKVITFFVNGLSVDLCNPCYEKYNKFLGKLHLDQESATQKWLRETK